MTRARSTSDGKSVKAEPLACKREIAYIPDNPDLYEYMTGIKYLNFIADIFGISPSERQARIRENADRFELTDEPCPAHRRLFPRHEAEAGHHRGVAA